MQFSPEEFEELFAKHVAAEPRPVSPELAKAVGEFVKQRGKKDTVAIQKRFCIGYSQCLRALEMFESAKSEQKNEDRPQ